MKPASARPSTLVRGLFLALLLAPLGHASPRSGDVVIPAPWQPRRDAFGDLDLASVADLVAAQVSGDVRPFVVDLPARQDGSSRRLTLRVDRSLPVLCHLVAPSGEVIALEIHQPTSDRVTLRFGEQDAAFRMVVAGFPPPGPAFASGLPGACDPFSVGDGAFSASAPGTSGGPASCTEASSDYRTTGTCPTEGDPEGGRKVELSLETDGKEDFEASVADVSAPSTPLLLVFLPKGSPGPTQVALCVPVVSCTDQVIHKVVAKGKELVCPAVEAIVDKCPPALSTVDYVCVVSALTPVPPSLGGGLGVLPGAADGLQGGGATGVFGAK
jgi:hypothetical protein